VRGWEPSIDLKTGLAKTYKWIEGEVKNKAVPVEVG